MGSEQTVTGSSLASVQDAIQAAWSDVPGDPKSEGARAADITRLWVTGGGIVGTQYHAELTVIERDGD